MPCKDELNNQLKGLQARITQAENDINAHYVGISQLVASLQTNPFTAGYVSSSALVYNFNTMGMKLLRALLKAFIPKELQKTMRLLTMLEAASLDDIAEGIMDSAAASALAMVNNGIDSVTEAALGQLHSIQNEINSLDSQVATGFKTLQDRLENGGNGGMLYQQEKMTQALTEWQNAVAAPIGQFTNEQIQSLRRAYLDQAKIFYSMQAGIAGAFATANGMLGEALKPTAEINQALKQLNSILAFVVAQDDITNCKSTTLKIG